MEIFGSYMGKDHSLAGEGARICGLDTFVAIMSGLIIFPGMFQLWSGSGCRTEPDLYHAAKCVCQYVWRADRGDVCFSFS